MEQKRLDASQTKEAVVIIDTPSGILSPEWEDTVQDLAPGDYVADGKGGWKQVRREKQREGGGDEKAD